MSEDVLPGSSFVCHDLEAHSSNVADNHDFVDDIRYHVDSIHRGHDRDSLVHDLLCRDSLDHRDHRGNRFDLGELEIALNCYLAHYCLHCCGSWLEIEMETVHR